MLFHTVVCDVNLPIHSEKQSMYQSVVVSAKLPLWQRLYWQITVQEKAFKSQTETILFELKRYKILILCLVMILMHDAIKCTCI